MKCYTLSHIIKRIGSGWDGVNFPHNALIVLCFVFAVRTVLITHQYFGYC